MSLKSLNKKYILAILILFLFISFLCYYFFKKINNKTIITPPKNQTESSIPARPKTFAEGKKIFINNVKLARIATLKNDKTKAKTYTNQAFILWRDVVNEFINTPPRECSDNNDWIKNISSTFQAIQEANQLLETSELELAGEKLDKSRAYLDNIDCEQQNDQTENKLFALLQSVKKIKQAQNLPEAKNFLDELKINYTAIKNISNNDKFQKFCQNFELILSEIDNATEATFPRSQAKLMPIFISIYENY